MYPKGVTFLPAVSHMQTEDYPALSLRNDSLLKSLTQNIVTLICFLHNICSQIGLEYSLVCDRNFFRKTMYQICGNAGGQMVGKCHASYLQSFCSSFSLLRLLFPLQNKSYKESRNHCTLCMGFVCKENCVDRDLRNLPRNINFHI